VLNNNLPQIYVRSVKLDFALILVSCLLSLKRKRSCIKLLLQKPRDRFGKETRDCLEMKYHQYSMFI